MATLKSVRGLVFMVAAFAAGGALAQDAMLGAQEFQERCAVCHGAEGAGDGMVGVLFAQKPKDLRILARENKGEFPFHRVAAAIDGRSDIAGHGESKMPVWGEYLMVEALESRGINPKDAAMIVNARIVALTQYIASIQVK